MTTRSDSATNRTEGFVYDGLDRLLTNTLSGAATSTVNVTYATNGNMASKSDAATIYTYGGTGPHALTKVSGGALGLQNYGYDANGNMTGGGGRTITWTSFNQVRRVQNTGNTIFSDFTFGAGHERIKEVAHTGTTVFIGSLFERVTGLGGSPLVENKHYIFSPTGRIAVRTERNDTTVDTRYFHTDGLGSITAVTNEAGQIVKRFAFDAWGKRVNPSTNGVISSATSGKFTRGFTDHEQLDDLGLVHMNGRIYDPVLGRFLSADPNVDGVSDAQGYNRYSYVGNNPINATDPSGYFSFKDAVVIVAVVVAGVLTAGAALYGYAALMGGSFAGGFAGALGSLGVAAGWSGGYAIAIGVGAGFGSSFAGSLLNGGNLGDAFKAGIIGGIVGGISAGVAGKIGDFAEENSWFRGAGQNLAHGALQGSLTEATGGEFRHGFYAGFASSASAGPIGDALPDTVVGRTSAAAVVGGTASAIGGGKFANGAVSAAFTHLFNNEEHLFRSVYQKPTAILFVERSMLNGDDAGDYIVKEVKEMNNRLRRSGIMDAAVRIEAYDRLSDIEAILSSVASPSETVFVGAVAHGQFASKDPGSFLGTVKINGGRTPAGLYRQTVNDAAAKITPNAGVFADHCSSLGFQPVSNILNDMSQYVQKRYPTAKIFPGSY